MGGHKDRHHGQGGKISSQTKSVSLLPGPPLDEQGFAVYSDEMLGLATAHWSKGHILGSGGFGKASPDIACVCMQFSFIHASPAMCAVSALLTMHARLCSFSLLQVYKGDLGPHGGKVAVKVALGTRDTSLEREWDVSGEIHVRVLACVLIARG